jgi:hypothetical protein
MARAIGAIRHKKMDWLKAKKNIFNLAQVTSTRRCQSKSKLSRDTVKTAGSMRVYTSTRLVKTVVQRILNLESRFFWTYIS